MTQPQVTMERWLRSARLGLRLADINKRLARDLASLRKARDRPRIAVVDSQRRNDEPDDRPEARLSGRDA